MALFNLVDLRPIWLKPEGCCFFYIVFLEFLSIILALRVFASYRWAFYILMFSLYLNSPVLVIYTGGLYSYNLFFYFAIPFGLFQLTKSIKTSLLALTAGVLETLFIYYLHQSGWDFAKKSFIEHHYMQMANNIITLTFVVWLISIVHSRSLTQAYTDIAEAQRFKEITRLSTLIVNECKKPLENIIEHCARIKSGADTEQNQIHLDEINASVEKMSSIVEEFRKKVES